MWLTESVCPLHTPRELPQKRSWKSVLSLRLPGNQTRLGISWAASPDHFSAVLVEEPLATITVPRDGHVMPLAVVSGRANEHFLVIDMQHKGTDVLEGERVVLNFAVVFVGVRQRCSWIVWVRGPHPERNREGAQVRHVAHCSERGGRAPREAQVVVWREFCLGRKP